MRQLKVRMLDGTVKTMLVDDSQPVTNLMVVICTKIGKALTKLITWPFFPPSPLNDGWMTDVFDPSGITNHDEYSLVRENLEEEAENKPGNFGTLTLRRKKEEKERDMKMEQLKKKIKTDDERKFLSSFLLDGQLK